LGLSYEQRSSGRILGARADNGSGGQHPVDHEQAATICSQQFELLKDRVHAGFFFHLFCDEPLQKDVRGVIFLGNG